jgi:hypothetical protein
MSGMNEVRYDNIVSQSLYLDSLDLLLMKGSDYRKEETKLEKNSRNHGWIERTGNTLHIISNLIWS